MKRRRTILLTLFLITVGILQTLLMPAYFYAGDNFAMRAEASDWLKTGKLGIDYSQRPILRGFLLERGQYFYENDDRQRLFSRYGFGETLFYLPSYALYKTFVGEAGLLEDDPRLLLTMNIFAIFLTIASAALLYLIASAFTKRLWLRFLFAAASIYSTLNIYYLRNLLPETFQTPLTLLFIYSSIRLILCRRDKPAFAWTLVASFAAGILLNLKGSFLLFYIPLGVAILCRFLGEDRRFSWRNMRRRALGFGLSLAIPAMMAAALLLWSNNIRFGSPFNTGYGQWIQNGVPHDHFSPSYLAKALPAFLWQKGNANVFLHYPLLVLGLPGLILVYKRQRPVFFFLLMLCVPYLLLIASYSGWRGEWCFGPRHLIYVLLALSIGFVPLLDWLAGRRPWIALASLVLAAVICIFSAWQIYGVLALRPFAYYRAKGSFAQLENAEIDEYFNDYWTRSGICRDMLRHAAAKRQFPPMKHIKFLPTRAGLQRKQMISRFVKEMASPNFYLFNENHLGRNSP